MARATPITDSASSTISDGTRLGLFTSAHNIDGHPLFKGFLSRWGWRFYHHRLTVAGRWFLIPFVLITLFAAAVYQQPFYALFILAAVFWLLALLAALRLPVRVAVEARHAERICAGETLRIDVRVRRLVRFPEVALQLQLANLPVGLAPLARDGVSVPVAAQDGSASLPLPLYCSRRGVYALQGFRISMDFPFGLLNAYRVLPRQSALLVYPHFTQLANLHLPGGTLTNPGGVVLQSRLGDSFELLGNRDYQDGDDIRHIDWRATARMQSAIVREYTQEYFFRVGIVLDTFLSPRAREAERDNFERAVSVCASVSDYMARQDYLVDIFAAGPRLYHLAVGQSSVYLDEILDILACIEPYPQESFTKLTPELGETLEQITLVICVFTNWDEERRLFVEYLTKRGVAVKIIVVRESPCCADPDEYPCPGGITVVTRNAFATGVNEL